MSPVDTVAVADCGNLGRRVVAARDLAVGEHVFTFRGPLICFNDALTTARERQGVPLQVGHAPAMYMDTAPPGVHINHGCIPNAGLQHDLDLVALCPIRMGEEVVMDYAACGIDGRTKPCRCGLPACRGWITDFALLPRVVQTDYLRRVMVPPFIVRWLAENAIGPAAPLCQFPNFLPVTIANAASYRAALPPSAPMQAELGLLSVLTSVAAPEACLLHGNLVLKSDDFSSGNEHYTFIGAKNIEETARELIRLARERLGAPVLRCVPEFNFVGGQGCLEAPLVIHEQAGRREFIFDTAGVASGLAPTLRRRHKQARRFAESHPTADFQMLDIRQRATRERVLGLFNEWVAGRDLPPTLIARQHRALRLLIALAPHFALLCTGVIIDDKLVAFSLNELSSPNALAHAGFALPMHGLMPHLLIRTAALLRDFGVTDWNYQDGPTLELQRFKRTFATRVIRYFEVTPELSA